MGQAVKVIYANTHVCVICIHIMTAHCLLGFDVEFMRVQLRLAVVRRSAHHVEAG